MRTSPIGSGSEGKWCSLETQGTSSYWEMTVPIGSRRNKVDFLFLSFARSTVFKILLLFFFNGVVCVVLVFTFSSCLFIYLFCLRQFET